MPNRGYDPEQAFSQLQREINQLFKRGSDTEDSSAATAAWTPAADIDEFENCFVLYMDVPGVNPTDIELTLDKGILTVSGNRERQSTNSDVIHQRTERAMGHFYRRFTLPDTADGENVKASGKNGVLEIVIPKQTKSQPRKIVVEG